MSKLKTVQFLVLVFAWGNYSLFLPRWGRARTGSWATPQWLQSALTTSCWLPCCSLRTRRCYCIGSWERPIAAQRTCTQPPPGTGRKWHLVSAADPCLGQKREREEENRTEWNKATAPLSWLDFPQVKKKPYRHECWRTTNGILPTSFVCQGIPAFQFTFIAKILHSDQTFRQDTVFILLQGKYSVWDNNHDQTWTKRGLAYKRDALYHQSNMHGRQAEFIKHPYIPTVECHFFPSEAESKQAYKPHACLQAVLMGCSENGSKSKSLITCAFQQGQQQLVLPI